MIRLTRRQWMALDLKAKTRIGAQPAVMWLGPDGLLREVPVTFVRHEKDSAITPIDTAANGQ